MHMEWFVVAFVADDVEGLPQQVHIVPVKGRFSIYLNFSVRKIPFIMGSNFFAINKKR